MFYPAVRKDNCLLEQSPQKKIALFRFGKCCNPTLVDLTCSRIRTTQPKWLILVSFLSGDSPSTDTSHSISLLPEVCRSVFFFLGGGGGGGEGHPVYQNIWETWEKKVMKYEHEIPIGLDAQQKKQQGAKMPPPPPPQMGLGLTTCIWTQEACCNESSLYKYGILPLLFSSSSTVGALFPAVCHQPVLSKQNKSSLVPFHTL